MWKVPDLDEFCSLASGLCPEPLATCPTLTHGQILVHGLELLGQGVHAQWRIGACEKCFPLVLGWTIYRWFIRTKWRPWWMAHQPSWAAANTCTDPSHQGSFLPWYTPCHATGRNYLPNHLQASFGSRFVLGTHQAKMWWVLFTQKSLLQPGSGQQVFPTTRWDSAPLAEVTQEWQLLENIPCCLPYKV